MIFWVTSYKYSLFKLQGTSFSDEFCSNSCYVCVSGVNERHRPIGGAPASFNAGRGFKRRRRDRLVLTCLKSDSICIFKISHNHLVILSSLFFSRSQWPRGLRRRSAATHLLGTWVRIPPGGNGLLCVVSVVT